MRTGNFFLLCSHFWHIETSEIAKLFKQNWIKLDPVNVSDKTDFIIWYIFHRPEKQIWNRITLRFFQIMQTNKKDNLVTSSSVSRGSQMQLQWHYKDLTNCNNLLVSLGYMFGYFQTCEIVSDMWNSISTCKEIMLVWGLRWDQKYL